MDNLTEIAALRQEIEQLRADLDEAQDMIRAIQAGEVDALMVSGSDGPQVYALQGADQPYRVMIEQMHEGAITLSSSDVILFSNQRFATMMGVPLEQVIGSDFMEWVEPDSLGRAKMLVDAANQDDSEGELTLISGDGSPVPVYVALNMMVLSEEVSAVCIAVTDLTEQKANERKVNLLQTLQLAIQGSSDIEPALYIVLERVCEDLGWSYGEVWRRDVETDVLVPGCSWYSDNKALREYWDAGAQFRIPSGHGSFGEAWQRECVIWIEDATDERFMRGALAQRLGLKSGVVVPIYTGQAVTGVLVFYSYDTRKPDDAFEGVILAVATQIGNFIERKHSEQALRASEERFRSLVEHSSDIIVTTDVQGAISYVSLSVEHVLGYCASDLIQTSIFDNIHLDDLPEARVQFANVVANPHTTFSIECRQQHHDGTWRLLDITATNYLDNAAIRAIVLNAWDITERRQMEQELRSSEERFRSMVQNSNDIITILDGKGIVLYESLSLKRVLGYETEEVLGQSALMMVHPEDEPVAEAFMARLLQSPQENFDVELRYKHKDGSWRLLEVTARNFLDDPNIAGVVVNSRDITVRRRIEQELRDSEERYRLVALATNDVMWDWNLETDQIRWNESLYTAFGHNPVGGLTSGTWWKNHVHPSERMVVVDGITEAQRGSDQFWYDEYRLLRADGTYAHVTDRGYLVRDADGRAVRMIGAMTDFTEQKRTEENLREALEELSRIYTQSTDMIGVVSTSHFMRVNPAFEQILGYTEHEILAMPFAQLIHPDDLKATMMEVERLTREARPAIEFENRYRCKDGSYRWIEWNSTPYVNGASYVIGRDITERYTTQEQIRALNAELEQRVIERTAQLVAVNKELEAFSYSVSHDLRAPLRAIDGFSHALLEDYNEQLPDEAQHFLARIRAGTQRMGQLIDDMLNLSRLTREEMRIETVDLSRIARALVNELQEAEPARQVEVVIADGLQAQGDIRLMRAALYNLFANAWKFTGKKADACIEFGVMQANGKPTFFVRDNGVGFDMAYADKLFGAFQRLHTQSEFEGTGVGLATVQRVIHRHGGKVWADSVPGEGATFYFTI
jgi:PAS domain S-box-containing protein